jgi:hypothetical protein
MVHMVPHGTLLSDSHLVSFGQVTILSEGEAALDPVLRVRPADLTDLMTCRQIAGRKNRKHAHLRYTYNLYDIVYT